jgi:hypothetical protein
MATFRLLEGVKKDALKKYSSKTELKFFSKLIAEWTFTEVQNESSGTVLGCKCGNEKKCQKNKKCEWDSLRIDVQRNMTIDDVVFNSYNLQWKHPSYAAVVFQCNVTFTAQRLRYAFERSLDTGKRVWMVNDEGKEACLNKDKDVKVDKEFDD